MSNQTKRAIVALSCLIASTIAKGQTNKISTNDGIWQDYGGAVSASTYPEIHGRLVNVNWSDIEDSPNHWHWDLFDTDVNQHIADTMPVIILVYTGPAAPNWIYTVGGVPEVYATNNTGDTVASSPYYLDTDYNNYFKRMIDSVKQHIQSYPSSTRNLIIAMQGCYGSTGDQIAYKGNVAPQYQITSAQFDSLFKVYSLYYYNTYKNLSPPIRLLSNPSPTDSSETNWLMSNCPGGWIKCGTFAKGSQVNLESDKQKWMYNILNQPQNGQFVMARCEITGPQLSSGKWIKNHYKEMFGIMCYDIYWGLDWPNETTNIITDHNYDSTFTFFNKYAGQKIPGLATNAMCALKDVLDASDSVRFPAATFGAVNQTNVSRYQKICSTYSNYGAKLEDTAAAIMNDLGSISSNGINDVGWHLLPGNYERYLHQINANTTSAGYWNIYNADTACMYGRYARGFDVKNSKNALYFDVDDNFLRNAPLNGKYAVTIEVTYLDSGKGSWALYYDSVGNSNSTNKLAMQVTCNNTNKWVKASVTLKKAYFGNRSTNKSDFYIKNMDTTKNVIFSVVELSRAQLKDTSFITTALDSFGTIGFNTTVQPNTFVVYASPAVLKYGSKVQIGPSKHCSFSTSANGNFSDTLFIYYAADSTINQTVYVTVKTNDTTIDPGDSEIISGNIPIICGTKKAAVKANATIVNSSPTLNPIVKNVTCFNSRNGEINLQPIGGIQPITYKWTNDSLRSWSATGSDVKNLQPQTGEYRVVITSAYGVIISDSFTIANGTSAPLPTPRIKGPLNIKNNQTPATYTVTNADTSAIYTWNVSGGTITPQTDTSAMVTWGLSGGTVSVYGTNACGSTNTTTLSVTVNNSLQNNRDFNTLGATPNKLSTNDAITLMPNPVRDIATIKFFTAISKAYTMAISDINGKLLSIRKNTSLPGNNVEKFDVANLSAGMYLITYIEQSGERKTLRMIKQ
jgi:hypothetical protein